MREASELLEEMLLEQRITNALLRAASRRDLEAFLEDIAKDEVDGAIIRALVDGGKQAGTLTNEIMSEVNVKDRAVRRHLAQLMELGIVQRTGGGSQTGYSLTGLFTSPQLAGLRASK